ncbi:MAG: hypothetical protein ABIT09_12355 [Croceibacterium sp.]
MLAVGYHVETGVRSFAEVAEALMVDLETPLAEFEHYLPTWYMGVQAARLAAGHDTSEMDIRHAEEAFRAPAELHHLRQF